MPNILSKPTKSYLLATTYTPTLKVGDISYNAKTVTEGLKLANNNQADLVVLPELTLTGYTLADMLFQNNLPALIYEAIEQVVKASNGIDTALVFGAPLKWRSKLYNCALVVKNGQLLGVIPKSYLPNYSEFYEKRWFASGLNLVNQTIEINGEDVPFGTDLIFSFNDSTFGVEICEDVWAPIPPSTKLVLAGADIICNLSASNELVGKAAYRREIILAHTSKLACGYVYASSGVNESTADMVMGGDAFIAENGRLIAEGPKFSRKNELLLGDIDLEHLRHDRAQNMTIEASQAYVRTINIGRRLAKSDVLHRRIDALPFVPKDPHHLDENIETIFNIQANGLASRMTSSNIDKLLLGLSGGLDSTLAVLVGIRALNILGLPARNLQTITMPGYASSKRTQTNADKLAKVLQTTHQRIPINQVTDAMLKALNHQGQQDVCYENAQARNRTAILLNRANQERALVIGTGDLSEIALGWCTYNGDHISHYGVNASVPKTLVKHMVKWVSNRDDFKKAKPVLDDILDTPISPELTKDEKSAISQKTEDIIGPYELHDFFLYYFRRWGDSEPKLAYLATLAFKDKYDANEINKWLEVFMSRFYANQWKRNVMPDGPKVGTVSLSPRADLRMAPETVRVKQ